MYRRRKKEKTPEQIAEQKARAAEAVRRSRARQSEGPARQIGKIGTALRRMLIGRVSRAWPKPSVVKRDTTDEIARMLIDILDEQQAEKLIEALRSRLEFVSNGGRQIEAEEKARRLEEIRAFYTQKGMPSPV